MRSVPNRRRILLVDMLVELVRLPHIINKENNDTIVIVNLESSREPNTL